MNWQLDTFIMEDTKSVTHHIFMDNLLIFTKANQKSLAIVKTIFDKFTLFSELTTNPSKSLIYYSSAVAKMGELNSIPNYPNKELLAKHLGVPLVGRDIRSIDCSDLLDKM